MRFALDTDEHPQNAVRLQAQSLSPALITMLSSLSWWGEIPEGCILWRFTPANQPLWAAKEGGGRKKCLVKKAVTMLTEI